MKNINLSIHSQIHPQIWLDSYSQLGAQPMLQIRKQLYLKLNSQTNIELWEQLKNI
jgi:hypothetical protein